MGRADLHMHTTFSDGILTPHMLLFNTRNHNQERMLRGLPRHRDVIAITDHDEIKGALEAAEVVYRRNDEAYPHVLVGEEITSIDGHILGINIKSHISQGMSADETVKAIHEQGGIAIAAHPFPTISGLCGILKGLTGVGELIHTVDFDAVEVVNGNILSLPCNLRTSFAVRNSTRALLGSSDSHWRTYTAWTKFPGDNPVKLYEAIKERTTVPVGGIHSIGVLMQGFLDYNRLKEKEPTQMPEMRWENEMGPYSFKILSRAAKGYERVADLFYKASHSFFAPSSRFK